MEIRAEVMRLSYKKVQALLKAAGLRASGKAEVLREELIAHRGGSTSAAGTATAAVRRRARGKPNGSEPGADKSGACAHGWHARAVV